MESNQAFTGVSPLTVNNFAMVDISKIKIDKDDLYKMFSKEQYRDYILEIDLENKKLKKLLELAIGDEGLNLYPMIAASSIDATLASLKMKSTLKHIKKEMEG